MPSIISKTLPAEQVDTHRLAEAPLPGAVSRLSETGERVAQFLRSGVEHGGTARVHADRPITERGQAGEADPDLVLDRPDPFQPRARRVGDRLLRGGADLFLVLNQPDQVEEVAFGQRLGDVAKAAGAQHPSQLGKGGRRGRMVERAHEDRHVDTRVGEGQPLGPADQIPDAVRVVAGTAELGLGRLDAGHRRPSRGQSAGNGARPAPDVDHVAPFQLDHSLEHRQVGGHLSPQRVGIVERGLARHRRRGVSSIGMGSGSPATAPPPRGRGMPDELSPRHLAIRVAQIAAVVGAVAIAIGALPGLDDVRARFAGASPAWIAAVAVAEAGSCAGYVLAFRSTFCAGMSWSLSYEIAMAEQAANALLPAGGAGGLALGVWALRQAGMPTGHIARRTVAFFVITSAPNFLGVVLVGLALFAGLLPGSESAALTLLPALITALGIVLVVLSPRLLRALGARGDGAREAKGSGLRRRVGNALRDGLQAAADGVEQAIDLLRSRSAGVLVGAFAYMAFDIAALGFAFAAVGSAPSFGVLVLAYLLGQLGNLIPLPGGIGGTEAGLVGFLALYGVALNDATAAVLLYRLFELAVPALLGTPAFFVLRRRLMRADKPALMCAPLALEVVKLPPAEAAGVAGPRMH